MPPPNKPAGCDLFIAYIVSLPQACDGPAYLIRQICQHRENYAIVIEPDEVLVEMCSTVEEAQISVLKRIHHGGGWSLNDPLHYDRDADLR